MAPAYCTEVSKEHSVATAFPDTWNADSSMLLHEALRMHCLAWMSQTYAAHPVVKPHREQHSDGSVAACLTSSPSSVQRLFPRDDAFVQLGIGRPPAGIGAPSFQHFIAIGLKMGPNSPSSEPSPRPWHMSNL